MSCSIDANRPHRKNDSTSGRVADAGRAHHCPCNADRRTHRADGPCGFCHQGRLYVDVEPDSLLYNNVFHGKISMFTNKID